ncbi:DUF6114 domain-containing protein [Micromonospora sp. HK10]|uniref:DUF6114 domain-containing protein n=1 Tax=Micromonospora sp. HK10 TaxID=1538294 RepID=UPI0006272EA7|nr:DUF6114 domain-containing protein [Micromonospora sp. HK10]KKJ94424.1 hypothetical protein LQ51_28080 [Micromonospora sp. HK10]
MTTTETQHARPSRLGQAWGGFRRWRRERPFWGGLFTALAGLEIFGTTQMSLGGLTFQMGPTGFLSWLIPVILVACGMLLWFSPAQRMFYAIVAAITALYSLIGVNLGGFFIGLLLGMIGSALGFAWVPRKQPAAPAEEAAAAAEADAAEETDGDEPALVDELLPRQREDETTGVLTDTLPEPRNPLREPAPGEPRGSADSTEVLPAVGPDAREGDGRRDPKLYAILLVLASVSTVGLLGLRDQEPAIAAPAACPTTSSAPARPARTTSASPAASAEASAAPAEKKSSGNLLTNIIDGITGLFTGDDEPEAAASSPAPTPEPTATGAAPTSAPTSAEPTPKATAPARPARPAKPGTCDRPTPAKPKPVEAGKPLPKIAAEANQPRVAAQPSKLTGSKVTMTGLHFDGVVDLPTGDGTLKVLKFSMEKAVTDDFVLLADGPAGKRQRYVTDRLTVQGDVAFYATRFVGYLLGIKITLTPDLPFPDGIPITSPIPITFTDPTIDLAFVDCNRLTAKPRLNLDLA